MSENEFYELQGNSFRGSRYSNFVGGGITPQGNVSSATTENAANAVGTSAEGTSSATNGQPRPSSGLTANETGETDLSQSSDAVVGSALPYAGQAIGRAAGSAIGSGASFGEGLSQGVSALANKVSGGLIGTASSPTNIAISRLGGKFGPATSSSVGAAGEASKINNFGSGANIGAAAGAGIATAAAVLLSGGSVKDAAKSGAGTAAGTAIGSAIGGPAGGFVGGFIGGSIFCFAAGTPILLEDGSRKSVENLELNDRLLIGGRVCGVGKALCETVYRYKNTVLSEKHAVFEDGKWLRAGESANAEIVDTEEDFTIVYPIVCEGGIVCTPWFISADVFEVPENMQGMTDNQIIEYLNEQTERNAFLLEADKGLPRDKV